MSESSRVHQFFGKDFSPELLKFLKSTFQESYLASVKQNSDLNFIKVYEERLVIHKSFAEFHYDVLRVHRLIVSQTKADDVFVSVAANSYINVVFLVSAILCGRSLCPINPEEGIERITAKVLQLSRPHTVWTDQGEVAHKLPGAQIMKIQTEPSEEIELTAHSTNKPLVYMFTSGSTGYSKIVEQMEVQILSNVDALIAHHELKPGKVIGTSLPVFHVNALEFSLFGALLSGAQLVLFKKFNLLHVLYSIEKDRITMLSLMPALLNLMLARKKDFLKIQLGSLAYVVSAASALSKSTAVDFLDTFEIPIVQGYGMSEVVNFSTVLPTNFNLDENKYWLTHFKHPSIGPALLGNEIAVLDSEGDPCGEGIEGEICIRGHGVMRSYLGVSPETLFSDGYFHSGDLGYFHADRDQRKFYFVSGRKKDVIKRFGETISLREIDDVLSSCTDAYSDAIAVGFENFSSGEEVGLIVTDTTTNHQIERLQDAWRVLPFYMRPKVFIRVPGPLRTVSGKPQRWLFKESFLKYRHQQFYHESTPLIENIN